MQYRKGEAKRTRFRADRVFSVGKEFYFTTREGPEVGPFPSRRSAERGITLYIKCMQHSETAGSYATKIAMQGLWASTHFS